MPRTSAARAASTTGGHRGVDRRRVHRVVPAHDGVEQRRVEHGAPARAGLVERARERHEAVARDAAVGRLRAHGRGDGRRLPDRAAGVGAGRERRLEGREHRARATAGAAGDAVQVPRVVRRAVGGVLGRAAHRELVHVGLAEDRQAGLAQLGHDGRVVGRDPALEDLAAARRRQALRRHDVLDRDRHAGERRRAAPPPRGARRPRGPGRAPPRRRRGGRSAPAPSTAAMRSRWAWVTSTEEIVLVASASASSAAVARVRSEFTSVAFVVKEVRWGRAGWSWGRARGGMPCARATRHTWRWRWARRGGVSPR